MKGHSQREQNVFESASLRVVDENMKKCSEDDVNCSKTRKGNIIFVTQKEKDKIIMSK